MVIKLGLSLKKDYEVLKLHKLDKINTANKIYFLLLVFVFICITTVAFAFLYSIDLILGFIVLSSMIGVFVNTILIFFVYGKLVWMLRLIAGDEDGDR